METAEYTGTSANSLLSAGSKAESAFADGYSETYAPISEARYNEFLGLDYAGDIDTFFSNMIRPNRILARATTRYRAFRIARILSIAILVVATIALLSLWNSGLMDTYLSTLLAVQK